MAKYSFESRLDLTKIEVEVDDTVYRSWSTKRRDADSFIRLIRDFAEKVGRLPNGVEALQLVKRT